jgi:FkbM family methyltransferase
MSTFEAVVSENSRLQQQLQTKLGSGAFAPTTIGTPIIPGLIGNPVTVLVTPNEVNGMHGTGVLLKRMFQGMPNLLALRTTDSYGGLDDLGDPSVCLHHQGSSRSQIYANLAQLLATIQVEKILSVPFFVEDVIATIAIADITQAPLCTYVMDDNSIYAAGIPQALMQELISKSTVCLAISNEMRIAYEKRFSHKFWVLPPSVDRALIQSQSLLPEASVLTLKNPRQGVLVGNIWSQQALDLLRETVRNAEVTIQWYCNSGKNCSWLTFDATELGRDGIFIHDPLPESELASVLRDSAFAILPSGTLEANDSNPNVTRLSLPTRVPFILASANLPLLILGSREAAVAKFVDRFQVGVVADYTLASFQAGLDFLLQPHHQLTCRQNAAKIAETFSDQGIADWIWRTLQNGTPTDLKYEKLLAPLPGDFAYYVEPPAPKEVFWGFIPDFQVLRRYEQQGYRPDFIVDVGASTGIWAYTAHRVFPTARFILVEPLLAQYDQDYYAAVPTFEIVEAAVSDQPGTAQFQVSEDLYGSSLLNPYDTPRDYRSVDVDVITLDGLFQQRKIQGRGILKIDVQCAEHLVIAGATQSLAQIDLVIAELSLVRFDPNAKTLTEMLEMMAGLGFEYVDEAGCWRSPETGRLLQKDIVFARSQA